jgi:hypothetical protein
MLLSMVLLAHSRIHGLEGEAYGAQTYFLYLQLSLTVLFGISYALAIYWRRPVALHARFMVCTALTLMDPVVIRLLLWTNPAPSWNYQWLTFGLTDAVFIALIWLDRHNRIGRVVFPIMLGLFMIAQAPALFGLTNTPAWQTFARVVRCLAFDLMLNRHIHGCERRRLTMHAPDRKLACLLSRTYVVSTFCARQMIPSGSIENFIAH